MRTSRQAPDTPEAKAHKQECEVVLGKLQEFVKDKARDVYEADRRPALRVVPTRDETARVHMTLEQLCVLMGIERSALALPGIPLEAQL